MRPNLAQDAPPTALAIGGAEIPIDVDFRTWIDVLPLLRDFIPAPETLKQAFQNTKTLAEIEKKVFGKTVPHPAGDVLSAILDFAEGYPEAPANGANPVGAPTYSFDWDLNNIIIAIMNQFGVDLTYRRKEPFHWWEFLAYFRALSGSHYILRLMEIRGYTGKDSDLKRQAQRFALPKTETAEDKAMLDAFDELFYNA